MNSNKIRTSAFISQSRLQRKSNFLFGIIIKILFKKVDLDNESLAIMKEYSGKGKTVYASFQSSTTSMIILNNLLKRHGFPGMTLSLGISPYILNILYDFAARSFRKIPGLFRKNRDLHIPDEAFIKEKMDIDESISISLLSEKLFISRYLKRKSDALQYLLEIQKETETPIYVFPQIMFWNRNPERAANRPFLSSKATGDRGLISGFFTILKSATPPFMRIASPVNLLEITEKAGHDDIEQLARELRDRLLDSYDHEKRTILGPVIKRRQEMMEQVLYHHNILDLIQEMSRQEGIPERKLRKKAFKYFREIAPDFSIITIKHFDRILKFMFSRIFSGIEYDMNELKKIREAARRGPVILVPAHKSNMDALILSCIFYREKIVPPHVLAGANLSFFPMGTIFRKSGAIFMRRSFKGQKLYTVVLKQYLKMLVDEGYSIEFFMEGGRTRNGKILYPRPGILKYLIEAVKEGYGKDLVFVPASISYSRILEETSYSGELKGKEKKKESTSQFVRSRKLLKRNYGKVYLSFNEPVSYSEITDIIGGSDEDVTDISLFLTRKIGESVTVTPVSLVSTAILASAGRGFSRELLIDIIELHNRYLAGTGVTLAPDLKDKSSIRATIDSVLNDFETDGIISKIDREYHINTDITDDNEIIYVLREDDRPKINFYKNSIIQHLLPLSMISLSILTASEDGKADKNSIIMNYYELMDILGGEFSHLRGDKGADELFASIASFLSSQDIITLTGDRVYISSGKNLLLRDCAAVLQDYLESYYAVAITALSLEETISRKEFMSETRKTTVRLYHFEEIRCTEALSTPNQKNALDMLISKGFIEETRTGKKDSLLAPESRSDIIKIRDALLRHMSSFNRPIIRNFETCLLKEKQPETVKSAGKMH